MKNSLTENDLKCGMIAYEVTELYMNTVMFVSDVYISKNMNSKCIDYKSFYIDGDNIVLGDYVGHGFLKDHNIGASYIKIYWFSNYEWDKEYFDSIYDKEKAYKLLTIMFF